MKEERSSAAKQAQARAMAGSMAGSVAGWRGVWRSAENTHHIRDAKILPWVLKEIQKINLHQLDL